MGGGKHEKQNPRGSIGGRKLEGDQLAEDVHGRKGMYVERRKKGQLQKRLETGKERTTRDLDNDEFQLIYFLSVRQKYCPSSLSWDDILLELDVIGVTNPSTEADGFIRNLESKTDGWLNYISYHNLCLRREHAEEIKTFLKDRIETNQEG
jgi:hypothetical protein